MTITIDQALADPNLLGAALGDLATWAKWRVILRSAFGLPLDAEQAKFFASVAGGRSAPTRRVKESWGIVGRRSGKSRMAAAVAVYLGAFGHHKLAAGETGFVLVLAASKMQARTVFDYARGFLDASPILRQQVIDSTADEIRLRGNIIIGVHTNNFRTIRGRTLLACIFDEAAFWRDETSSQPDIETYRAVLPALMTTGGPLIGISSPYAMRGLLFERWKEHFGKDGDVLVIKAESLLLNPTLDREVIDSAISSDPEAGRSEWLADWRGDLAIFVSRENLERCVEVGTKERPPQNRFRYFAFCDPSGGQSDSMTLAIAHKADDRIVLDLIREQKPPFEPAEVVSNFARLLKTYRVTTVRGDRYAGEWVASAFRSVGISYMPSERSKSELYRDCLPLLMNGEASLLDDPRLISQFSGLERRTARTGDVIDHMRGAHDDLANAAAGVIVHAGAASWTRPKNLQSRAITSDRPKPWHPGRLNDDKPKPVRLDGGYT